MGETMSYEGYEQFVCPNGHTWKEDAGIFSYGTDEEQIAASTCRVCSAKAKYVCSVDETNGYDPNDPSTFDGPVTLLKHEDKWCKDHYGNKYAVKVDRVEPILSSGRWREY
jgi:hypothetical protein